MWYEERSDVSKDTPNPTFSLCCQQGLVKLPNARQTPKYLDDLLDYKGGLRSFKFRENIRVYNSMFQFTSIGGKIDNSVNTRTGPYVFKISGQNHHKMGSLLPKTGQNPKFAQLYIYYTENECSNRINAFCGSSNDSFIDRAVVAGLMEMLDGINEIVRVFRIARDIFREIDYALIRLRLVGRRNQIERTYAPPTGSEVAALIVGDIGEYDRKRDGIVDHKIEGLKRISDLHPSFMAMQYPLLFPYGEDGYNIDIKYVSTAKKQRGKNKTVTIREFYAYIVQQRLCSGNTLLRGGRLFQQFIVDAYSSVEEMRLQFIKDNKKSIRCEMYKEVRDCVAKGDLEGNSVWKRILLPSSFTAGPRYLFQNYQDAMAICRYYGYPDLFITFTCNVKWPEIKEALLYHCMEL